MAVRAHVCDDPARMRRVQDERLRVVRSMPGAVTTAGPGRAGVSLGRMAGAIAEAAAA